MVDWITAIDGLLWLANLAVVLTLAWAVYRQQKGTAEKLFLGMVMAMSLSVIRHVLEIACQVVESSRLAPADAGLSRFFHALWPVDIAALVIFAGLSLHFTLLFPRLSALLRRWPRLPYFFYVPAMALAGMMLTILWLSDSAYRAFWHLGNLTDDAPQLAFVAGLLSLGVARSIYVTFSEQSALVRRRMRGLLAGAALATGIAIITDYLPNVLGLPVLAGQVPGLLQLPSLIFFSAFVWAIQRRQILDVRWVLSRSLAYILLSAALVLAYLLLTLVATLILQREISDPAIPMVPLLAALVVVAGAIPLRDAVLRSLDRLFHPLARDYREILHEHSRQLVALMSPTALMTHILDSVETNLRPQGAVIVLREGETFAVRAVRGHTPGVEVALPWNLSPFILQRLQQEGEPISLEPDVGSLERLVEDGPQADNLKGITLIVPFVGRENLIGWLGLWPRQNGSPYTLRQRQFLTTLANQSCVALQNADLYEKMRRKASELAVLNAVSTAITSSLDLDEVLQTIANSVISIVGCQKMAIYVLDETRWVVNLAMGHGLSEAFIAASQAMPLGDSLRTATVISGQPLTVPDIQNAPGFADMGHLMAQEDIRSMAEVPLWGKEGTIGSLAVYYAGPRHFTTEEMEPLTTLATQAAIALDNASLYAMTDQALARRAEELSVVEVINRELAATLDLERVIGTVLRRAIEITGAPYGLICLVDESGTGLRLLTYEGYPPQEIEPYRAKLWPSNKGIISRTVRLVRPIAVADVTKDPDYVSLSPDICSHLSLPIVEGKEVLGALMLESPVRNAFDAPQIDFVSQWVELAAPAIKNARLYMEAQQRINQLSSLQQFGLQVVSSLHLQAVLDAVAESALKLVKADDVRIFLYDAEEDSLTFRTGLWASGERAEGVPPARPHGLTFTVAHSGKPLVINDTLTHPLFASDTSQDWRVKAIAGFPLKHAGQVLGVFNVAYNASHTFTDDELRMLMLLSSQAATAIANARLFQQVAEGRDHMEAVLNSVREGILMLDLRGRIVMANPTAKEMLDVPSSQLVGYTLQEIVRNRQAQIARSSGADEDWPALDMSNLAAGQACSVTRDVIELYHPSRRFLERVVAPVEDKIGTLLGCVVILRDITEQKELERMRDDLSDTIIHDLRAPLAAIINGSSLLQEILAEEEMTSEVSAMLGIIATSSQRMLDLVNSLLDISRMEAGKLTLHLESFALSSMVDQVVTRLRPLSTSHGVGIESLIPPGFPKLCGDREKISRIFVNLLDNAIKFTPRGGQVWISAQIDASGNQSASNRAICSVLDTGPGIPPEHRERIFEKFAQLSLPPSSEEFGDPVRGSGIGLNYCRSAVEAHGGHIWVEAGPEGRGSNFKFTLPLADGSEGEAEL